MGAASERQSAKRVASVKTKLKAELQAQLEDADEHGILVATDFNATDDHANSVPTEIWRLMLRQSELRSTPSFFGDEIVELSPELISKFFGSPIECVHKHYDALQLTSLVLQQFPASSCLRTHGHCAVGIRPE